MSNTPTPELLPCDRGCVWPADSDDVEPKPKPATHGLLCASCYHRLKRALEMIPDLMANMRASITPGGAQTFDSERISGGGDGSPAPLRVDPLDASDALYAKLVSWTEVIGDALKHPQPSVAVWISFTEVMGSKTVTPSKAHEIATQLTAWFLVRLEQITEQSFAKDIHDDICWGFNQDNRGVYKLTQQYGVEPRPLKAAEKRQCPICGRMEVFVKWPDTFDPELAIMCGRCKWVAEPEKYGHYAKLFAV
jgi:hypothetical protein